MEWIIVIGLILFGLGLLILEILFVPGTTVVGIAGFLFEVGGIYLSYDYFGTFTGNIILVVTFLVSIAIIIVTFKAGLWQKLSLKEENTGKVNEGSLKELNVGDEGITLSSLKPIGKALFHDNEFEVRTDGEFLYNNVKVVIKKIQENKIIVEPI